MEKVQELIKKLAEKENINEKLKQDNQVLWVSKMNNIKNIAEEIILNDYNTKVDEYNGFVKVQQEKNNNISVSKTQISASDF